MEVVIVEDELSVAEFLAKGIEAAAYRTRRFDHLDTFSKYIQDPQTEAPNVFVLDRMIHHEDTADLLLKIKARFPESKILFLSAVSSSGEKIKMLNAGADDYLSKPFAIEELVARIGALCRRTPSSAPIFELKNVCLNHVHQTVEVAKQRLDLSKKEYQLLSTMISQPTRVFSRVELLQMIWDQPNEIGSNVVEVTIKNLRRKLDQSGALVKIQSKRYIGYWIEA